MNISNSYKVNIELMDKLLDTKTNFDIVHRTLIANNIQLDFYFIDGFVKDEIMEKIFEALLGAKLSTAYNIEEFSYRFIPYVEVDTLSDIDTIVTNILSGSIAMFIDGYFKVIMIDARTYPVRGVAEPEADKVLRGSRDGFVETVVFNCALIRRRIRSTNLKMEILQIGTTSHSDIVISYMDNKVDKELLTIIKDKLNDIDVEAFTMSQESLSEALIPHHWYDPFPKVRYTERPDNAASNLLEGRILLMIDNSPAITILPTYFLDFVQESQDYYFPPLIGTYLRSIRLGVFFLNLLLTPLWLLAMQNPEYVPSFLNFIIIKDGVNLPFIIQFIILELGIDAIKLASLNTPSTLSSSFSIIGALILGEFAIKAGWFNSEVILYMAFVSLASFTMPSFELGYAIKFIRILLLILVSVFNVYGLLLGLVIFIILLYKNNTITNTSYLYPIIPFSLKELKRVFIRSKLKNK
ncbi:MAG: spore germination protein [Erysipelotrichaceae bacterium]